MFTSHIHTCVNAGADADAIRTSYKRLAQKWHPEKNPRSEEAVQVSDSTLL